MCQPENKDAPLSLDSKNMIDTVAKSIAHSLNGTIADSICGFKLMVSKEIPKDEVWFIDLSGGKHVIKNAEVVVKVNLIKGVTNES